MVPDSRPPEEYELLSKASSDLTEASDTVTRYHAPPSIISRIWRRLPQVWMPSRLKSVRPKRPGIFCSPRKQRSSARLACWVLGTFVAVVFTSIIFTAAFRPSYTHLPDHYNALQRRCLASSKPGRGNIHNEKVFIAAALYDPGGELASGSWGNAVLELVELLGPGNVYVSVYENDADPLAIAALNIFRNKLSCDSSIVSEHFPPEDIPRVRIPSGEKRAKRIAFLAEVRNRALRPLARMPSGSFDRVLFINDVIFNPIDALNLLFSTNVDASGRAQYGAACAMDFINAFKFYDTFATRDLEGYSMGIPFFPWFTDAGEGRSRRDVLEQKDAVRVRACWGGMTAFEAKWFRETHRPGPSYSPPDLNLSVSPDVSPLRFRYEKDPFWDASECCLVHADLTYLRHGRNVTVETGIFANPFIRVAYDLRTLRWLPFTRRVERLYSHVHNILNHVIGLPYPNPRRLEHPEDEVVEIVWRWDPRGKEVVQDETASSPTGSYQAVQWVAAPGRFCGSRKLLVSKDDLGPGEKKWESIPLPLAPTSSRESS